MSLMEKIFGTFSDKELKKLRPVVEKVNGYRNEMRGLTDHSLQEKTQAFRERLAAGETLDDILPEAFAVCREASRRVLEMEPFDEQIIGGIVLHRGCIAEMQTGEGKTLVATLPVYLNALAGSGVHVVTVNDYLARRDSEWMGKVYRFLGLTVGLVVHETDSAGRRAAYAADVTYGTNNEFGFDYLRDNMVAYKQHMVQRGHAYAIVDEVDSILIDEARTPLIISGKGDDSSELYQKADELARKLKQCKVVELDDKAQQDEQADGDYIVDEKHKTATLTKSGIAEAERFFKIDNLSDAENMTIAHHVNQAIKAHGVMKRDTDYVVQDDEVIIVDEFTGRLMIGRRYNEGLHQAIEAKEGVKVAAESKTLATITFQNYFRMYKKLAGMTGTARTEADEFSEIYGLNIVSVPTHKPCARQDLPDSVYKSEKAKFDAVIAQVLACHAKGQPVLVGTVSIEKSEHLSSLLKKQNIKHEVLNAKEHKREAEIIAQAGKKGAVTIATNMAGRGTDIMLGGNPDYMAKTRMRAEGIPEELIAEADGHAETADEAVLAARERFDELREGYKDQIAPEAGEVKAAGGLFIIGTERHESRRIDNQLRGRSGRQGDAGASRFFLSLEDDLMRLFGGERVQSLMNTLGLEENIPIENKMITSTIEGAQKRLEGRNFSIRKNVLQFDDVMNQQREIIYGQRRKVLDGEDISAQLHGMMKESIEAAVNTFMAGDLPDDWDFAGLRRHYQSWLCGEDDFRYSTAELNDLEKQQIAGLLLRRGEEILAKKEKAIGSEMMREAERICLLHSVDTRWMDHIDAMDQLRQGIYLRSYGQHDPVVEYRFEGFEMFDAMVENIREEAVKRLLTVEVQEQQPLKREQVAKPAGEGAVGTGSRGGRRRPANRVATAANAARAGRGAAQKPVQQPVRVTKIGRNELCPCGSKLKWKKCRCAQYHEQ